MMISSRLLWTLVRIFNSARSFFKTVLNLLQTFSVVFIRNMKGDMVDRTAKMTPSFFFWVLLRNCPFRKGATVCFMNRLHVYSICFGVFHFEIQINNKINDQWNLLIFAILCSYIVNHPCKIFVTFKAYKLLQMFVFLLHSLSETKAFIHFVIS